MGAQMAVDDDVGYNDIIAQSIKAMRLQELYRAKAKQEKEERRRQWLEQQIKNGTYPHQRWLVPKDKDMGIGGIGHIAQQTITVTQDMVPRSELEEAREEIARLEKLLGERDEIIEALIADMDTSEPETTDEPSTDEPECEEEPTQILDEDWIPWDVPVDYDGAGPFNNGNQVIVKLRDGTEHSGCVWWWGRCEMPSGHEIIAYKEIP